MIELTRDPNREVEKEVLFSIDGAEVEIPKEFSASLALQYVDRARKRGLDDAGSWLLETVLGPEGYALLLGYEELKAEHLADIMDVLITKTLGAMEAPKGKLKAV